MVAGVPTKLRVLRAWLDAQIDDALEAYNSMRAMPSTTDVDRAALLAAFRTWDDATDDCWTRASIQLPGTSPAQSLNTPSSRS